MTTNMTKEGQLQKMWPTFIGFLSENFVDETEYLGLLAAKKGLITHWTELEPFLKNKVGMSVVYEYIQYIMENYVRAAYDVTLEKYPDEELRIHRPLYFFSAALPATMEALQDVPAYTELRDYGEDISEIVKSLCGMAQIAEHLLCSVTVQKTATPAEKEFGKSLEKLYRYMEFFMTLVGCI